MADPNQSWSIVIFGYNEGATLASVTGEAQKFLETNNIPDSEILIVDDGSTDNTQSITNTLKETVRCLRVIRHGTNLGIGPALVTGYTNARCENVVAVPADGQFDINELQPCMNIPERAFVSFYREQVENYSPYRNLVTVTNRAFNKFFLNLNVKDVNWVKAYRTSDLKSIDLKLHSSIIGSEICAKLQVMGYRPIEAPSVYHPRIAGKARGASLKTVSHAVKELLKLVFIVRKFKKICSSSRSQRDDSESAIRGTENI